VLLGTYVIYCVLEIIHWICFGLDNVLYPGYQAQPVSQPVFIIGNPRSGTTFLHRLMAQDDQTFASFRTWEILFAPTVVERKFFWAVHRVDQLLGSPMRKLLTGLERRLRPETVMHKMGLWKPEEDEYLMLHIGSSITAGLYFGVFEEVMPYAFFDTRIPPEERRRVMAFYKHCLQRHLHAHDNGRFVLSKNPYFSPKVDALLRAFPDARFIYLVRTPLKVLPSYTSLSASTWDLLFDLEEPFPFRKHLMKMVGHWYRYPLDRLAQEAPGTYQVVRFEDLVSNPARAVREIYAAFGLDVSPAFAEILREETVKARNYQSQHAYSLEGTGYTREQLLTRYADVFARFGFERSPAEPDDEDVPDKAVPENKSSK
jgi:hypothetical protein